MMIDYIDRNDDLPLNKWVDFMDWCPSQCYCRVQDTAGKDAILYLRWRHEDPWQAHIIKNAKTINEINMTGSWTGDLFEKQGLYFLDKEYDKAKEKLLEVYKQMAG